MQGPYDPIHQPQRELFAQPRAASPIEKIEAFLRFPLLETWGDIAFFHINGRELWSMVLDADPTYCRSVKCNQLFRRPHFERIPNPAIVAAIYASLRKP